MHVAAQVDQLVCIVILISAWIFMTLCACACAQGNSGPHTSAAPVKCMRKLQAVAAVPHATNHHTYRGVHTTTVLKDTICVAAQPTVCTYMLASPHLYQLSTALTTHTTLGYNQGLKPFFAAQWCSANSGSLRCTVGYQSCHDHTP